MKRLATVCPHCGGPEQLAPACVTCGEVLWFQTPVPEDVEDTDERHYPGLAETPLHTVVRGSAPVRGGAAGTPGTPGAPGAPGAPGGPVGTAGGAAGGGGTARGAAGGGAAGGGSTGGRGTEAGGTGRGGARVLGIAVVTFVLAGLVLGGWRFLEEERADVPVAAETGPAQSQGSQAGGTVPDTASPGSGTQEPSAACSGDYVLVTPAATDVPAGCEELAAAVADLSSSTAASSAVPAAFEGPFRSSRVACRRRDEIGGTEVHVRQLSDDAGPRVACACLIAPRKLPDLGPVDVEGAGVGRGVSVSDAQLLLHEAGLNPDQLVGGSYGKETEEWVRRLQERTGLPPTGRVDRDTWKALLGSCG